MVGVEEVIGYIQLMFIILLTVILLCLAVVFAAVAVVTVKRVVHEYKRSERQAADEERRLINEELDKGSFDEADIREKIAQDFDRMSSQLNPDDRERSALYSRWATNAADRIRHPERYSGAAKAGSNPWDGIPTSREI